MLQNAFQYKVIEAGCDEAGRGCYAGPVFAAAVVLPKKFYHPKLNDSKQVKEKDRDELRKIIENEAIDFAVAKVEAAEIDKINILKASFKAMHLAIAQLKREPKLLLIDGNRFIPYKKAEHKCIVKGDGLYANIAAASILAKTYRDEYMKKLHEVFPQYDWLHNKGYGTLKHRQAIEIFGICDHHRKSFNIVPKQLDLF
ncbi:ribonuclease HII [Arachidicoccus soli]|uniref:Ribonuclease HII n=1 Tax=Arachidicoccus soli TaxID=2341117 RepID=A0A386HLE1_9BACT|nr:ribonuclease HII [Arachidicoccus soli]AYD46204.1 ribonuclease HII [Arachidicoccus soli]